MLAILVVTTIDFLIPKIMSHITGSPMQTLHEYLGLPPEMNDMRYTIEHASNMISFLYSGINYYLSK